MESVCVQYRLQCGFCRPFQELRNTLKQERERIVLLCTTLDANDKRTSTLTRATNTTGGGATKGNGTSGKGTTEDLEVPSLEKVLLFDFAYCRLNTNDQLSTLFWGRTND